MKFPENLIIDILRERVVLTSNGTQELHTISPQVQALKNIEDFDDRVAAAVKLASEGYVVDPAQDAFQSKPFALLRARRNYGVTWVPSLLHDLVPMIAPGIFSPAQPPFDPFNPPLGAIFIPPVGHAYGDPGVGEPPKPPEPEGPPQSPIGPHADGIRYLVNPLANDKTPSGGTYTEGGITYRKVITSGFAGLKVMWWERQ